MTRLAVEEHDAPSIAKPPTPMVRHLVDRGDWAAGIRPAEGIEPQQKAMCGYVWDRLGVSNGPLCDACAAEFMKRHGRPHPLART